MQSPLLSVGHEWRALIDGPQLPGHEVVGPVRIIRASNVQQFRDRLHGIEDDDMSSEAAKMNHIS